MTLNEILKGHAFTTGLSEANLARLSSVAYVMGFEENEVILLAGQQSKFFYLLFSGSVCIEVSKHGCTFRIQTLRASEAFGWCSLLDRHDTLFQVRARERSTAVCLDGSRLSAAFQEDAGFAVEFLWRTLKLVAGRLQATEASLGELCGLRTFRNI